MREIFTRIELDRGRKIKEREKEKEIYRERERKREKRARTWENRFLLRIQILVFKKVGENNFYTHLAK